MGPQKSRVPSLRASGPHKTSGQWSTREDKWVLQVKDEAFQVKLARRSRQAHQSRHVVKSHYVCTKVQLFEAGHTSANRSSVGNRRVAQPSQRGTIQTQNRALPIVRKPAVRCIGTILKSQTIRSAEGRRKLQVAIQSPAQRIEHSIATVAAFPRQRIDLAGQAAVEPSESVSRIA